MTYLSKHNFLIKLCLQKRIDKGLDIFFMFKHQFKIVDLNNKFFFDDKISIIISKSKTKIKKKQYKKNLSWTMLFFIFSEYYYCFLN